MRVGLARDQAPGLALVDQIAHGLLAHAGAGRQLRQARAAHGQVPRDVDVRRTDLVARRQVGQRQRHVHIAGHQREHALVKAAQGLAEQSAQVREAPGGVLRCRMGFGGLHPSMLAELIRQTD